METAGAAWVRADGDNHRSLRTVAMIRESGVDIENSVRSEREGMREQEARELFGLFRVDRYVGGSMGVAGGGWRLEEDELIEE
eukprot:2294425-Pleurochrysis_carterae.AAC.1